MQYGTFDMHRCEHAKHSVLHTELSLRMKPRGSKRLADQRN